MKISQRTLSILKNYSWINNSLFIKAGSVLNINTKEKNIISRCVVEEIFPVDFGISRLNDFLAAMSLFKECSIEFGKYSLTILQDNKQLEYVYCSSNLIVDSLDLSKLVIPAPEFECLLSGQDMTELIKTASGLNLPDLSIKSIDSTTVELFVTDLSTPSSNRFSIKLKDFTTKLDSYTYSFKVEHLRFLPGDYTIKVSSKLNRTKAMAVFKHNTELEYCVIVDSIA